MSKYYYNCYDYLGLTDGQGPEVEDSAVTAVIFIKAQVNDKALRVKICYYYLQIITFFLPLNMHKFLYLEEFGK